MMENAVTFSLHARIESTAPGLMTPHRPSQIVQQDFKVTDSYTAPKGTLIMPSITAATMQVLAGLPANDHAGVPLCSLGSFFGLRI